MQQKLTRPSAADRELASALNSSLIHALRAVSRSDAPGVAGPAGLSALSVLVFAGSQRLGDLAAAEKVAKATMSRVVDVLEKHDLARRRADPTDGRVVWVDATKEGKRVLMEARERRVVRLAAAVGELRAAERSRLRDAVPLLERLAGALDRPRDDHPPAG